jgi:hypothetical protein
LLTEATEDAKERAKPGRKRGTGRHAFDMFVTALLAAVEKTGGRLTIFKTSHTNGGYDGSLLKAVNHLRPYLPKGFCPAATLGRSLHTVYERWRRETGKSPQKKK